MLPRHFWAAIACVIMVLAMLPDASQGADNEERLILSLTVNGRRVDDAALVLHRADGFYVPRAALTEARIVVGPQARIVAGPATNYVALSSIEGVTADLDSGAQDLKIHIDPKLMTVETVEIAKPFPIIVKPADFGGFINYDIVGQGVTTRPIFPACLRQAPSSPTAHWSQPLLDAQSALTGPACFGSTPPTPATSPMI